MKKVWAKQTGFTIVELLIVVVVIAILAAITIVAFNGIQQQSRDSARTSAVSQIRKALEAYRVQCGKYPDRISIGSNIPAGFSDGWGNGYSFSVDTAGNWLKNLTRSCSGVDGGGVISRVPVDPKNDNTYYLTYWSTTSYGVCTEQPFYVLAVKYENSSNVPSDSRTLNCSGNGVTGNWVAGNDTGGFRAVFSNIKSP